jgi:hypothetical protein
MILHKSSGVGNILTNSFLRFANFKQDLVALSVADFKVDKLNIENVVFRLAKKLRSRLLQVPNVF